MFWNGQPCVPAIRYASIAQEPRPDGNDPPGTQISYALVNVGEGNFLRPASFSLLVKEGCNPGSYDRPSTGESETSQHLKETTALSEFFELSS